MIRDAHFVFVESKIVRLSFIVFPIAILSIGVRISGVEDGLGISVC